jgi:hypothetical protein
MWEPKVGTQIYFLSTNNKPTNSFLIPQLQIRKFPRCPSPQIAKPAHLQGKKQCSDPDPEALVCPPKIFILDYEIPCNSASKLSQKPKLVLKLE